jgi:hypothetical protein
MQFSDQFVGLCICLCVSMSILAHRLEVDVNNPSYVSYLRVCFRLRGFDSSTVTVVKQKIKYTFCYRIFI